MILASTFPAEINTMFYIFNKINLFKFVILNRFILLILNYRSTKISNLYNNNTLVCQ